MTLSHIYAVLTTATLTPTEMELTPAPMEDGALNPVPKEIRASMSGMGIAALRNLASYYLGKSPRWSKMTKPEVIAAMEAGMIPPMAPAAPVIMAAPTAAAPIWTTGPAVGENQGYSVDADGNALPPVLGDGLDEFFTGLWQPGPPKSNLSAAQVVEARRHIWDAGAIDLIAATWGAQGHLGGLKPMVLTGEAGDGKSASWRSFAWRTNRQYMRVSLGLGTNQADLIGRWIVKDGELFWVDGVFPKAAKAGALLNLEEIDSANDGILASVYSALEPTGDLLLKEKDGEVLRPAPGFWPLATANSFGSGDESGRYTHSQTMSGALRSRFWGHKLTRPSQHTLHRILSNWGCPETVADHVSKAMEGLRSLVKDGAIQSTGFGTREAIGWALASMALGDYKKGFMVECGTSLSEGEFTIAWETASRFVSQEQLKLALAATKKGGVA